jgi:salicylate hydroxylase
MTPQRIVIAGGGIGGLTAAVVLAQDGHEVVVLEQAQALGASVGAGVTLAPNAMKIYGRLGLEAALCAAGVEPQRQRVQHWQDGRSLVVLERGQKVRDLYGAPYLYIHRADLHSALITALEATGRATVRLGASVESASASGDEASVQLRSGETVAGDIVIAADGVKSPIRRLFEPASPHFTGHVAWRAVIPVGGSGLDELAAFPGIHIGPGRMAVRYPISRGEELNFVFFARQSDWAPEGWAIPGRLSELHALFGDWADDVRAMLGAIDENALFKWGIFARTPLSTWVHQGRIALLGDAAHAMTPFLGQGASAAIEDAVILGRCLSASAATAEGLGRYERARMDRCAFIQLESNANADRLQGDEAHLFGMVDLKNEETLGLFAYDAYQADI